MDNSPNKKKHDAQKNFAKEVGKKEVRKLKGRKEKKYKMIWFGMGMSGVIGWSISIPTLIGIAVGIWIDENWPSSISWTLTFLGVGIALGCLNAWYWIKMASKNE